MKSTDTGIVNIHGKEYKTVALRVSEFRTRHSLWSILTEIVHRDIDCVVMKCTIVDEAGRTIATGHSEEYRKGGNKINLTSALENAESSAVGRALAFYGLAGSELASADEVAHAITSKQQAHRSEPNPMDAVAKWGRDNSALIDRAGQREDWDNASDACDLPALRAIVKVCKSRTVDTSPVSDNDIPA